MALRRPGCTGIGVQACGHARSPAPLRERRRRRRRRRSTSASFSSGMQARGRGARLGAGAHGAARRGVRRAATGHRVPGDKRLSDACPTRQPRSDARRARAHPAAARSPGERRRRLLCPGNHGLGWHAAGRLGCDPPSGALHRRRGRRRRTPAGGRLPRAGRRGLETSCGSWRSTVSGGCRTDRARPHVVVPRRH